MSSVASLQAIPDASRRRGGHASSARVLVFGAALAVALLVPCAAAAQTCPSGTVSITSVSTMCSAGCSVLLYWTPPSGALPGETTYDVYVRPWSGLGWCGAPGSEFVFSETTFPYMAITNLVENEVFETRVEVVGCPSTSSPWVGVDTLMSPALLPTLAGGQTGPQTATLTFTPPDAHTPRHELQRAPAGSSWSTVSSYPAPAYCPAGGQRTYTDTGLSAGTYQYRLVTSPSYAGGGGTSNVVTVTIAAAPQIVSFTASPSSVPAGQPVTLAWSSTGGQAASIDNGVGTVPTSGSVVVTPLQTTTYTLTVSSSGGPSATAQVTVTVLSTPVVASFTATPPSIPKGQTSTLAWSSTGGQYATIDNGVGEVPTSGTAVVAPQQTTTYTLAVTGPGGTATRQVTVTVLDPPVITSFTATPPSIPKGQTSRLAWSSTGGTSATLDNGFGAVPTNGFAVVGLSQTTTYTLTVTGPGGTATRQVTVTVLDPPAITSFTATPGTVPKGQPATLAWASTGGASASIDGGVGAVPLNGSVAVTPLETTTYTLTVTGPGGTATRQVTVTVVPPPVVTELVAEPPLIAQGDSTLLRWSSTGATSAFLEPGGGPVPTTGSLRVSPVASRLYVLTVTGPGGSASAEVAVTVERLGVELVPGEAAVPRGETGELLVRLGFARAARTVVALAASPAGVVAVPESVVVPAGQREAAVPVGGLVLGSATVSATLPETLGGGQGTATVEVTCPSPAAPALRGPAGSLPPGAAFNASWTPASAGEPAASFLVELATDSGFASVATRQETTEEGLTLVVPGNARDAVFVRVRGVAACGGLGAFSNVLRVAVAGTGPLVVVSQGQSPSWAVVRGAPVPPATLRFRNIGGTATQVTFAATGGFFTALRAVADLAPGAEVVVDLAAAAGAGATTGARQGSVLAIWPGGSVAAPVSLTVADAAADVVPLVEPPVVVNTTSGGGVQTREVRVTNPSGVPITLAPSVRAGGAWLTVEPLDVAEPLAAGATRTVRLRIDRAQQTPGDGPPPLFAHLELRSVGASAGALVRVYDSEPGRPVEVSSRTPADPQLPSFFLPSAVHAAGDGGAVFTTDLTIRNLSTRPIPIDLLASPRGGGASLRVEVTIPALTLVRLYDLVQVAFGSSSMVAAVEIRPKSLADAAQLVVRAMTEGQAASSSTRFAAEVPVYATGTGAGVGGPALVMTGVEVSPQVRTNVILAETTGRLVRVALELVGPDGVTLGTSPSPVEVPGFGMVQGPVESLVGLPAGTSVAAASLWIVAVSGEGRAVAFGTAIDNGTQSFRTLTVQEAAAPGSSARLRALDGPVVKPVVIPSVVRASGIGAFFTSLLSVTNQTVAPATVRFVFDYEGQDGTGAPVAGTKAVEKTIPGRGSLEASQGKDIVVNLLGLPSDWQVSGPLRIEGPGLGQVIVRSWVQTPSDLARPDVDLKFAELRGFSAGSSETVGVGAGSVAALSPAVARLAGQRSNVILTEVSGGGAAVRLKLVDGATGGTIGTSPALEVGAYRKVQINEADLWRLVGLGNAERAGLQLVVEAVAGPGRVAAVLTTIDAESNATLVAPFAAAGPQSPGVGVGR